MKKKLVIAVDGTAGSGKTTTFKKIAQTLNYQFIDTGLMYRAFALFCLKKQVNLKNKKEILVLLPQFNYQLCEQKVWLNGADITDELQKMEILAVINEITVITEVRDFMVRKQREMALNKTGIIMLGRDITSKVLPNADLKIYLDSSIRVRAERRYQQNIANHIPTKNVDELFEDITHRDWVDKNRRVNPLVLVHDAWYIDNSDLTLEQVVDLVSKKVMEMELE